MTINIKDTIITMTDAEKRTFNDDRKKLVDLAIQMQASTEAFNSYANEVGESFKDFGITPTGLKTYARAKAKENVSGELAKLEAKIEELQFLEEDV